jgi:hypothetical protein
MFSDNVRQRDQRWGTGDVVLKGLLAGILVALVVLIWVVLTARWPAGGESGAAPADKGKDAQEGPPTAGKPAARAGELVSRPPDAPKPPPTVGDPERLREVLQEGKTYEVVSTADLEAPVRDKDWGLQKTVYLAYRAELRLRRHIEKNDGQRIVELRSVEDIRMVKATSTLKLSFKATEPGVLLLGSLDAWLTGGQITAIAVSALPVLEWFAEKYLNDANTKIKAKVDSLKGKKVRIIYEDGKGVTSLQPVGCFLTKDERNLFFASAVVGDAFLWPKKESKPGDAWEVPGEAFSDLLPPSWRGTPRGTIQIRRGQDFEEKGQKYAWLECYAGTLEIDASDASRTRLASLTPRGQLKYNISAGHVESAELDAQGNVSEASRDHLLFEARFETQPKVRMTYHCVIVNPR